MAVGPGLAGYDVQITSRAAYSDVLTFSAAGLVHLRTQVHGEVASLGPDALGTLSFGLEMGTADGQRTGAAALNFTTAPGSVRLTRLDCAITVACAAAAGRRRNRVAVI